MELNPLIVQELMNITTFYTVIYTGNRQGRKEAFGMLLQPLVKSEKFQFYRRIPPRTSDAALFYNEGFMPSFRKAKRALKAAGDTLKEIVVINGEAFLIGENPENITAVLEGDGVVVKYLNVWVSKSAAARNVEDRRYCKEVNAEELFSKEVYIPMYIDGQVGYFPNKITPKEWEKIKKTTIRPDEGVVYRNNKPRIATPKETPYRKSEFMCYDIAGKQKSFNLNRVVYCAAHHLRLNDIILQQVDHIDSNTLNNRASNLQLVDGRTNIRLIRLRKMMKDYINFKPSYLWKDVQL